MQTEIMMQCYLREIVSSKSYHSIHTESIKLGIGLIKSRIVSLYNNITHLFLQ